MECSTRICRSPRMRLWKSSWYFPISCSNPRSRAYASSHHGAENRAHNSATLSACSRIVCHCSCGAPSFECAKYVILPSSLFAFLACILPHKIGTRSPLLQKISFFFRKNFLSTYNSISYICTFVNMILNFYPKFYRNASEIVFCRQSSSVRHPPPNHKCESGLFGQDPFSQCMLYKIRRGRNTKTAVVCLT